MTFNQSSNRKSIELDLVKRDASLYLEIMVKLSKQKAASILVFGLVPYFSLFIVEAENYLSKTLLDYNNSLTSEIRAIITAARTRVKFFDDNQKGVGGTFDMLDWISKFHEEWHINRHKGLLSPIQRRLQDDLGVFFYGLHIIGSTHTAVLNLGYSQGDLPERSEEISSRIKQLSLSVGEGISSYVSKILNLPELLAIEADFGNFAYNISADLLKYKDEKSEIILSRIFNGPTSEPVNLSLLLFLTQVNYLQYILTDSVSPKHYTPFKLKYIFLYHLTSSLEKLQSENASNSLLTDCSIKYIERIILDATLRELVSKRQFRNILVHYGIPKSLNAGLSLSTELYGLTEYFFNGNSYEQILNSVNAQISRISSILEEWLNWQVQQARLHSW
jgi:hypothetical protein